MDFAENENFLWNYAHKWKYAKVMHGFRGKTTSKHIWKVPNISSHSSSAYKSKTQLKNRNPQILGVEYAQNLWIPKLHKNDNKQ